MLSVILPVGKDFTNLERTIRSVRLQTNTDWELLAVDFGSEDGRNESLQAWPRRDPRIRVGMVVRNRCPAAARNAALQRARGEFITYLDPGDEYYPNYLAEVVAAAQESDVLFFGFDIAYENGSADGGPTAWDPGQVIDRLFAANIVPPLGVAHRRSALERVGGFNELLCRGEDWDLWKRLARAGLRFRCLASKSGRHSAAADRANRERTPTPFQLQTLAANWQAGRPLYCPWSNAIEARRASEVMRNQNSLALRASMPVAQAGNPPRVCATTSTRKVEWIAFVSPHCLLDFTNGAATATIDQLRVLQQIGFQCRAFCGPHPDGADGTSLEDVLHRHGIPHAIACETIQPVQVPLLRADYKGISAIVVQVTPREKGEWEKAEVVQFLTACEAHLRECRPDAVLTYGGALAGAVHGIVKALDIPLVFALHNFQYGDPRTFRAADYVVVPSDFCRRHYWEKLGLACQVLPLVVDPARVGVDNNPHPHPEGEGTTGLKSEIGNSKSETNPEIPNLKFENGGPHPDPLPEGEGTEPKYLTFVNPVPRKGVYVVARIADVLARRRPDIPLLLVEGAAGTSCLAELGIDVGGLGNIATMPNTPDPRQFYAASKLLLMPSLWNESFGMVAAEAMLNGIPVLASNRGALPETIGDAGFLFDIPAKYTPETSDLPTADEVEPWVETIIRLWDDAAEYDRWSRAARERAEQWHPDRLGPVYREFFAAITHQPGPPLVPKAVV